MGPVRLFMGVFFGMSRDRSTSEMSRDRSTSEMY